MSKGFGDPNIGGLGFGDPSGLPPLLEQGFGSPDQLPLRARILGARTEYPHTGGAEIRIAGEFADLPRDMIYRARANIGGVGVYLFSGRAGRGSDLRAERRELVCYSPPAPVGDYDLTLLWGDQFAFSETLSGALKIVPRNRGAEKYALRALWPAQYPTGPRRSGLDPIDAGATVPPLAVLENILLSAGGMLQELGGAPQTVLSSPASRGDTILSVESRLGFSSGSVWVGSEKYQYTSDNNPLQITLLLPLLSDHAEKTEVAHANF
jgi:hypothetical protein